MVADGLYFPEGPRWRPDEGKLYFSDVMAGKVSRLDENGVVETVFEPGEFPSGLGFLDNGDMLVVATESHEIVKVGMLIFLLLTIRAIMTWWLLRTVMRMLVLTLRD